MLNIPGWTLYRLDMPNKKGGGVCIYVASKWAKYITLLPDLSNTDTDVEILSLQMNKPMLRKLLIGCVYRPPTGKMTPV